jgi:hypothetical protein
MRGSKRAAAVATQAFLLVVGCSTADAPATDAILPGFLDLHLKSGWRLVTQEPSYPFRFAQVIRNDQSQEIEGEPYVDLLHRAGWVDKPAATWPGALVLQRGQGSDAACVRVGWGLMVGAEIPRGYSYFASFQQWPCSIERFIFPGLVDLPLIPGNWLEAQSTSVSRIITTEGFRQTMFDDYVESLTKMSWVVVASGTNAVAMKREGGPCLGVIHFKATGSDLNVVEFRLSSAADACPLPTAAAE